MGTESTRPASWTGVGLDTRRQTLDYKILDTAISATEGLRLMAVVFTIISVIPIIAASDLGFIGDSVGGLLGFAVIIGGAVADRRIVNREYSRRIRSTNPDPSR
jgi:hypothetical protein